MASKVNSSPTMASAAVCSKAVVLLLLIHCLLLFPLFMGVGVKTFYCFAIICDQFLVLQSSRWGRERERELIVLLLLFSEFHITVIAL